MTRKVIPGKIRLPEFELPSRWLVTEKIDGTNVRVILDPEGRKVDAPEGPDFWMYAPSVRFSGRTDAAQTPAKLLAVLQEMFLVEKVAAAFDPDTKAILFGEGYGPGIQKFGGNYRSTPGFRLFDVVVFGANGRPWWLEWENVADIAEKLGIQTVPVLYRDLTLEDLKYDEVIELPSAVAWYEGIKGWVQEGVVARTVPLLFTRNGQRVMWKLKGRDF